MLDPLQVAQIRTLLTGGQTSHRRIARDLAVARGTVTAMAHGLHRRERASLDSDEPVPSGPFVRCPECGALVQLPCLACRLRNSGQGRGRPRRNEPAHADLALRLLNGERARYEAIRQRKIAAQLASEPPRRDV